MASDFDAEFAAFNDDFFGQFGESVSIKLTTDLVGAAKSIKAFIPREDRVSVAEMTEANVFNELHGVQIAADDVKGVADIKEFKQNCAGVFHQIQIGTTWWGVRRVTAKNVGGMHTLDLFDGGVEA